MPCVTLIRYLVEQARTHGKVSPELRLLREVAARTCEPIGHAVSKGAPPDVPGGAGADRIRPILDIQPMALHPRIGVVPGSKHEVDLVTGCSLEA